MSGTPPGAPPPGTAGPGEPDADGSSEDRAGDRRGAPGAQAGEGALDAYLHDAAVLGSLDSNEPVVPASLETFLD